jgi:ABC-type transport system involved in multi-copper enzyme maturation permease subunit
MLLIAKLHILKELKDARYLFLTALVLLAFLVNAFVYSEKFHQARADYNDNVRQISINLSENADSLQDITVFGQRIMSPPSPLAFIADGDEGKLPNSWLVNAFIISEPASKARTNPRLPIFPAMDWSFIVGTLMSLLVIMISFDSLCGEKRDGTLRLLLSYPVSRIQLFIGKFMGSLFVVMITLLVAVLLNLLILTLNDALPLSELILLKIGWALLLSLFVLSFVLLLGMAVSAMVQTPSISLVVLIIIWIIFTVAIPGTARLAGEQMVDLTPAYQQQQNIDEQIKALADSLPVDALSWNGDPFKPSVKDRAKFHIGARAIEDRVFQEDLRMKMSQAYLINSLSFVSPTSLLAFSLQEITETGVSGFGQTYQLMRNYRTQLHGYTVSKDAEDSESPHLVYSYGYGTNRGVYSTKPVELSTVPRANTLWTGSGLSTAPKWPYLALVILLMLNLAMVIGNMVAFVRYDPR